MRTPGRDVGRRCAAAADVVAAREVVRARFMWTTWCGSTWSPWSTRRAGIPTSTSAPARAARWPSWAGPGARRAGGARLRAARRREGRGAGRAGPPPDPAARRRSGRAPRRGTACGRLLARRWPDPARWLPGVRVRAAMIRGVERGHGCCAGRVSAGRRARARACCARPRRLLLIGLAVLCPLYAGSRCAPCAWSTVPPRRASPLGDRLLEVYAVRHSALWPVITWVSQVWPARSERRARAWDVALGAARPRGMDGCGAGAEARDATP